MLGFPLSWCWLIQHCTLNFDPILDEIFREWSVVTAVYYVVTAIPKLRNIWSFRALAAFWVSLWSTSVCQAVAAVHSVVRRLHRGLTQRHSHNNIKHHSISSNIQFRLSTKASLNIFGLFISVWGGFPSNIGSHAELIHCAMMCCRSWSLYCVTGLSANLPTCYCSPWRWRTCWFLSSSCLGLWCNTPRATGPARTGCVWPGSSPMFSSAPLPSSH